MRSREALAEIWQSRIDGWLASGMTQAMFCEAQGISFHAFGYWRSRLNKLNRSKEQESSELKPAFVPVKVAPVVTHDLTYLESLEVEVDGILKIKGINKGNLELTVSLVSLLKGDR